MISGGFFEHPVCTLSDMNEIFEIINHSCVLVISDNHTRKSKIKRGQVQGCLLLLHVLLFYIFINCLFVMFNLKGQNQTDILLLGHAFCLIMKNKWRP